MKSIIIALLATGFSGIASGFEVFNQTNNCLYVKEYYHILNRYNQHIDSYKSGHCDPSSTRCSGILDLRVISHSNSSKVQFEEALCVWEGDVGNGLGYFIITPNPGIKHGEKDWCKINYLARPAPKTPPAHT